MKGLFKILPPFTPDYSGVCSVLFELGGIVVIHDASGCTGNFTGYDEPRWYADPSAVYSSGLREVDAILGDDEKLLGRLEGAVRTLGRSFVAIIGSPAPMVIGTDYRALARMLEQRMGLPMMNFDTNGMRYYDHGASLAFLELARRFVKPASTDIGNGVNIIGATPLDLGSGPAMERLTALLANAGCRVISCWTMGTTLEEIAKSAQARLNIAISSTGLEAARYLEREYGIPYMAGIPVGRVSGRHFVDTVRSSLGLVGQSSLLSNIPQPVAGIRNGLVIGEQVMSNAIRDCLRLDMRIEDVAVASFFGMDQALQEDGDRPLSDEDDLTILVEEHQYDIIVGDPLYVGLLPPSWQGHYVDFPHIALSSRLYWDKSVDYIGEVMLTLLRERI